MRGERSRASTPPRHSRAAHRAAPAGSGEASVRANPDRAKELLSAALLVDVAQDPAPLGDCLDEFGAAACIAQLLAELRDEDVDDLGLRLVVCAAIEMFQEHRASDDIVASKSEQLEHAIFHLRDPNGMTVDADQSLDLVY